MLILAVHLATAFFAVYAAPISKRSLELEGTSPFVLSEYTRLFDTLSAIVQNEYSGQPISHADEDSGLFEEAANNTAISPIAALNRNASRNHMLFQGDMRIPLSTLRDIVDELMEGEASGELLPMEESSGEEEEREAVFEEGSALEGSGGESDASDRVVRRSRRQAIRGSDTLWDDGVPYAFHPFLSQNAKDLVMDAIGFWERETCINFRPKTNESVYLYFLAADGCWSTVGRDDLQGQQWLSIAPGCEEYGIVTHEIGHALGLFHEQSRFDRDDFVDLDIAKVQMGYTFQFSKVPATQMTTHGLPYDVGSIMHYAPNEFSTFAFLPALKSKDPYLQATMGQLGGPSFVDVSILNRHYACRMRCRVKIRCSNYGYQDPRDCSRCKCPSGFGGPDCRSIQSPSIARCGGELHATTGMRQLKIKIKENKLRTVERSCIYHIVAPLNSERIEVTIKELRTTCMYGCWKEGMELKTVKDPRPVGYRFCCKEQVGASVFSERRRVPVMVYSRGSESSVIVNYRYVPSGTTTPPPTTTTFAIPTFPPPLSLQAFLDLFKIKTPSSFAEPRRNKRNLLATFVENDDFVVSDNDVM